MVSKRAIYPVGKDDSVCVCSAVRLQVYTRMGPFENLKSATKAERMLVRISCGSVTGFLAFASDQQVFM